LTVDPAPVLHLSLPVRDLDESRAFYVDVLGCSLGRVRDDFIDVWFYGMQVSLHLRPSELAPPGVRHFGVTLPSSELRALVARVDGHVQWIDPLSTDYAGTPREQTKSKLADPSGNVIELKSYGDANAALERPTP
jgi:extradiol dioxygenase family protein